MCCTRNLSYLTPILSAFLIADCVLQSKTSANAMQYVYALGTPPLAQYGSAWEYLLADALGAVRQIIDADGSVTLAESYKPYGNILSSNGTASSISGYAGEQINISLCENDLFEFYGRCYTGVVYTIGYGGQFGGSLNGSLGPIEPSKFTFSIPSWDWMFYTPGPTYNQVWERAVADYAQNTCDTRKSTK